MKVRVVNPSTPFFSSNPRRRRRRSANAIVLASNPRRRRRRSNSMIMPMSANPLILPNRGRKRRNGRRRMRRYSANPAVFGGGFLGTALTGMAGGGVAYWADRLMFNKLGRVGAAGPDGLAPSTANGAWIRNGARVIAGGVAAYFFRGNFGAAINGGLSYPVWGAIDEMMTRPNPGTAPAAGATNAYLTDAYLTDVLDGF